MGPLPRPPSPPAVLQCANYFWIQFISYPHGLHTLSGFSLKVAMSATHKLCPFCSFFFKYLFTPLYKGWGWNQLIVTRLPSYERKLVSEYLTVNKTRHQQTLHQLAPSLRAGKDWYLFIWKVNRNISNSWERTMTKGRQGEEGSGPFHCWLTLYKKQPLRYNKWIPSVSWCN